MSDVDRLLASPDGRASLCEAVAKAMRWRQDAYGQWWPPGVESTGAFCELSKAPGKPPDYLSDDPALNDEMEQALCNAPKTVFISITLTGNLEPRPHLPQVTVWTQRGPGESRAVDSEGKTKAEALVRALYAAGLLLAAGKIKEDDE